MDNHTTRRANQRPDMGNSHTFKPRLQTWHAGDYEELFIFITPCKSGAVWVIKDQGKIRGRDFIIAWDSQSALDAASDAARRWVCANAPGAKLRFRSSIERAALIPKPVMGGKRRFAA